MYRYCIFFLVSLILLFSCDSDNPTVAENLKTYISSTRIDLVKQQLIACAASGNDGLIGLPDNAISVIFYPEGNASNFKYFESENEQIDSNNFENYKEVKLEEGALFNGYLRRFIRPTIDESKWCIITFIKDNRLHVSDPIILKPSESSTEFDSSLVQIDLSENLSPSFSWMDGWEKDNVIYFHVVSDNRENLISGTYTSERSFKFYDLSNVILNIRDVTPIPFLEVNNDYTFTLLGVSDDNWVNLIIEKSFSTK